MSQLNREFEEKDIQRMRNIISGNTGNATRIQVGYTKDKVTQSVLDKLTAKADIDTINSVCGLNLKKIEHITQTQAMACLTKLMTLNK